jgi:spore maturation protein CgeB
MEFVVFGLSVTSSWGNGHATTWRGLLGALHGLGHHVTFFERDVPYYAAHRDLPSPDFCDLVLYPDWAQALPRARAALAGSDVAIVTSFCPDGIAAAGLVLEQQDPVRVFYDIDTPVTLAALEEAGIASTTGARYLTAELIPEFDLYLSFTGGPTLGVLEQRWGARRVSVLYCSVDPAVHAPIDPDPDFDCALGYLGTYSADRQPGLDRLLLEPARRLPDSRFCVVGPMYPADVPWPANVHHREHLAPARHAAFYCANRITLNLTRAAMIGSGYSPSVRLFEASACGVPILTDRWPGLEQFFEPGREILVATDTDDALAAIQRDGEDLARIARAARERVLAEHSATRRAEQLVDLCGAARTRARVA